MLLESAHKVQRETVRDEIVSATIMPRAKACDNPLPDE
jgi:hypothetical protein